MDGLLGVGVFAVWLLADWAVLVVGFRGAGWELDWSVFAGLGMGWRGRGLGLDRCLYLGYSFAILWILVMTRISCSSFWFLSAFRNRWIRSSRGFCRLGTSTNQRPTLLWDPTLGVRLDDSW